MEISTSAPTYWRKCTTCKKPIQFKQKYWICSVSTCNRIRTQLVFCDLRCFDAHVPVMSHRDAGAFEKQAPSESEFRSASLTPQTSGVTSKVATPKAPALPTQSSHSPSHSRVQETDQEILVVVSKVKSYIRSRSNMNTSDSVMSLLSDRIRRAADEAIQRAEKQGRKTVLDRDI